MQKLINFILNKRHWFVFLLLEVLSFAFIYQNNAFQHTMMLSSASEVCGRLNYISSSFYNFVNLKHVNMDLMRKNGELNLRLSTLNDKLNTLLADTVRFKAYIQDSTHTQESIESILATVVNNSVTQLTNYITINKGRTDGVLPDMGVVSEKGVVGIVTSVSSHFAIVLPILNPKSKLSCKIGTSDFFGTLIWDGKNISHANLTELPRHVQYTKGEPVVTSGYSAIFPANYIVGTVESLNKKGNDDNFYSLRIQLATTFESLGHVRVIINHKQMEQKMLEKEDYKHDK